jgi:hypothetical protein
VTARLSCAFVLHSQCPSPLTICLICAGVLYSKLGEPHKEVASYEAAIKFNPTQVSISSVEANQSSCH